MKIYAVLFVLSSVLIRRFLIGVIIYLSVYRLVVEHESDWRLGKYKKENGSWLR
jgi:hypothetical protein